MAKFIPYQKLSKKKRRELDLKSRTTWGELNPCTRKSTSNLNYKRKKDRHWNYEDISDVGLF